MDKISRREWFFIIALAAIIEYIVFDWSYRSPKYGDLVTQVSFAGTIVGIILAVIAIFQSFIQSESQSRISGNIEKQLSELTSVVATAKLSEQKIQFETDKLSNMLLAVHEKIDHIEKTAKENTDAMVLALNESMMRDISRAPHPQTEAESSEEILDKILRASSETIVFAHTLTRVPNREAIQIAELVVRNFAAPWAKQITNYSDDPIGWVKKCDELTSKAYQMIFILNSAGWITINTEEMNMKINPELINALDRLDFSSRSDLNPVIQAINSSFD